MTVDSMIDHAGSMTGVQNVINQLKKHEGFRSRPYTDTTGHLTIGYGLNLSAGITERQASMLLEESVLKIKNTLQHVIKCWSSLTPTRQSVLTNMAYNLGISGLLKFEKMLKKMEAEDYAGAADEMLNSLWSVQVGNRAMELSEQMRAGKCIF